MHCLLPRFSISIRKGFHSRNLEPARGDADLSSARENVASLADGKRFAPVRGAIKARFQSPDYATGRKALQSSTRMPPTRHVAAQDSAQLAPWWLPWRQCPTRDPLSAPSQ